MTVGDSGEPGAFRGPCWPSHFHLVEPVWAEGPWTVTVGFGGPTTPHPLAEQGTHCHADVIVKLWKEPESPSGGDWIRKVWPRPGEIPKHSALCVGECLCCQHAELGVIPSSHFCLKK